MMAHMAHGHLFPLSSQPLPLSIVSLKTSLAEEIKAYQTYCCNSNYRELFKWIYNFDNLEFHLQQNLSLLPQSLRPST